ncbi:unnamed protein product [Lactuca saligna]|uniref:DUF4283 domain-containing protein n=1 Tax=Lactuca saligna TaxID=75948 RepID=A0AA35YNG9_LACSI|nr:unnamed protein product [Lactuca saligna]
MEIFDVYTGTKKRWNGQNFAFIRIKRVRDIIGLEEKVNCITYNEKKLMVNVSTQLRKMSPQRINKHQVKQPMRPNPKPGVRDQRSYAADRSGHFPKLLLSKEGQVLEIKYIGGLKVLLRFDSSIEARSFMENKQIWVENLKWVKSGEILEKFFERVAWVRIVGLLLKLWGEKNFEDICRKFEKTIAPYDDVYHMLDMSCVKVGIITTRRIRINEEIVVATEDQRFKVWVFEFDEDRFPFHFGSSKNFYEGQYSDDDEENSEDKGGISETRMEEEDDELGEGEILKENHKDINRVVEILEDRRKQLPEKLHIVTGVDKGPTVPPS